MNKIIKTLALLAIHSFILASIPSQPHSLNPMLSKIMPAIVNIKVQNEITWQQEQQHHSTEQAKSAVKFGSGVILNAKFGYIVTNSHVVHGAKNILITLSDGREYIAHIVGEDETSDLAVLKTNGKNLTEIKIGRSNSLNVGDYVTAIGNPFGLHQTVTSGIISGLHRRINSSLNNFIQTDAPINPGNSGGALTNLDGELIGINTSIISSGNGAGNIGIGFAIPSDMMINIVEQLVKYNNVKRGLLGVTLQELTPQLAAVLATTTNHGAIINSISDNSAATAAGLKITDIITNIDDLSIYTPDEAKSYIGVLRENSKVAISVERNNKTKLLYATLKPFNSSEKESQQNSLTGISLLDYDELNSKGQRVTGVLVIDVEAGSKAWLSGITKGDIIIAINKIKVNNLNDFSATAKELANKATLLEVQRGTSSYLLVIED